MSPVDAHITCQRCGTSIRSFSRMRKWCIDCRRIVSLEQARNRKRGIYQNQ